MAAIKISVSNDLYTIETDQYEWNGLTVNGASVSRNGNGGFSYTQSSPGPIDFTVTASLLNTVNDDPNCFVMEGSKDSHIAVLTYSKPGAGEFSMQGLLSNVTQRPDAQSGPFTFSQSMMTGTFIRE